MEHYDQETIGILFEWVLYSFFGVSYIRERLITERIRWYFHNVNLIIYSMKTRF